MKIKALQKLGGVLAKNSPSILTGLGVAGLVSTVIMAVRATPKALEILGEEQVRRKYEGITEHYELIPKMDIIKLTWKCYLPAAIVGTVTAACIISANSINLRRNTALVGLYSLSESALKEYQNKVVETIGENKARKVKDEIKADKVRKHPVSNSEVIITGHGETLCYDELGGRYFKSDKQKVHQGINNACRIMLTDDYVSLNQVYSELGLKETKLGDMLGWRVNDDTLEPDFSSCLTEDGIPCLVVGYTPEPTPLYRD